MVETTFSLMFVVLTIVSNGVQRASQYAAGVEAGSEISGFVDLYYDYEVELDESTFPKLSKKRPPLPDFVYRLIPPQFLHEVLGAEVAYPDDGVEQIVPLARLPNLKVLRVTWSRYTDDELRHLQQFTSLEYLNLSHSLHLSDDGIMQLVELRHLKVFVVSGDRISESGLEKLRQKLPLCRINGRRARDVAAKQMESPTLRQAGGR